MFFIYENKDFLTKIKEIVGYFKDWQSVRITSLQPPKAVWGKNNCVRT
jgi:Asp-tRNA(Asn)/Glu-tRNA(Gln) amidotransferase C subunit